MLHSYKTNILHNIQLHFFPFNCGKMQTMSSPDYREEEIFSASLYHATADSAVTAKSNSGSRAKTVTN